MHTAIRRAFALIAMTSWVVSPAQSLEPLTSARTVLASLHPGSTIEQIVTGDLDKDGVQDVAYLVRWPAAGAYAVGTLRGTGDNGILHWTHTARLQIDQRLPEIAIKGGSLYVTYMRNGMGWGNWRTLQYSNRASGLVLVGEEVYFRSPRLDFEPGPVKTENVSTNYLTCRQIKSNTENKKRTEVKSNVEDCKLSRLEELD